MEEKYHKKHGVLEVWWEEADQAVRVVGAGVVDETDAEWLLDRTIELGEMFDHQVDWLLDLSQISRPTAKARRKLAISVAHKSIHKYAMVGASVYLRTVANFIATAAGQKNARHFATEQEALDWFHQEE